MVKNRGMSMRKCFALGGFHPSYAGCLIKLPKGAKVLWIIHDISVDLLTFNFVTLKSKIKHSICRKSVIYTRVKSNYIPQTIYYIVYEPRQRVAFRIPVESVSFKSLDYIRHRACTIARLGELYTTCTTILRQIECFQRIYCGVHFINHIHYNHTWHSED